MSNRKTVLVALIIYTFLFLMVIVTSSCATAPNPSSEGSVTVNSQGGVIRYIDDEAGVVCYLNNGYQRGGIDCFLISETRLGR